MHSLANSMTNLTKVSMNLTKHLLSGKNLKEKNVVFSPLSLYTVLSMVATGSEGATQHQLLSFLQSKSTSHLKSLSSHIVSSVLSDGAPVVPSLLGLLYSLRHRNKKKNNMHSLANSMTNLTKVSMNLTKHLLSGKNLKEKNVVFSPLSLYTVLSMVATGSEGATQHQLLSFLQSKSTSHLKSLSSHIVSSVLSDGAPVGGPRLSFANGMWVEQSLSLQPSFKQLITTDFKATLASVDFLNKPDEACKEVNLWVENNTKGLIKDILSPGTVHSLTRLIFANALYFKGAWKQDFDISKTKDYDFHLLNGSSVKVPFMTSQNDQLIRSFDGFKVLGLPYKQGNDKRQFSIYIFLPDAKDGLLALIDKVTSNFEYFEDKLPRKKVEVGRFRIPKFNISFGVEATKLLNELGLVLPFEMGGLTKMVDSPTSEELFVSDIIQKSFIELNEEGTTAAAVTITGAGGYSPYMRIPTLIDFVADHPFLFIIRDDFSRTILFTGQVLNPLAK